MWRSFLDKASLLYKPVHIIAEIHTSLMHNINCNTSDLKQIASHIRAPWSQLNKTHEEKSDMAAGSKFYISKQIV